MSISYTLKSIINEKGVTQAWAVKQMNLINPEICMNATKFSAIVCGCRKMSGDELIAFCMATQTSPDKFIEDTA